jgi:hypothetical protein
MASKAVVGIVDNELVAAQIFEDLQDQGFTNGDISILIPEGQHMGAEKSTKMPEGAATGAAAGGALGGLVGFLAGVGSIAIPGVGPFIAAGPILAALGGAAAGATAGGVTGALVGLGMPEYEAKQYESRLSDGKLLISVHTDSDDQRSMAKDIFERHGAESISTAGESSPPKRS